MTTRFAFSLSALLLLSGLTAQDETASAVGESVQTILKKYNDTYSDWLKSYRSAKDKAARDEAMKAMPEGSAYIPALFAAIDRDATDLAVVDAAHWMLGRGGVSGADATRIFQILVEHHTKSERISNLCIVLGRNPHPLATKLLLAVEANHGDLETRAKSCYYAGLALKSQARHAFSARDADEAGRESLAKRFGAQLVKHLAEADALALQTAAEQQLERVLENDKYAQLAMRGSTLGDTVKRDLFELRNLSIGKVAPEIEGEDLEGTPMKLTDYRGKVVVIDFWGDW